MKKNYILVREPASYEMLARVTQKLLVKTSLQPN